MSYSSYQLKSDLYQLKALILKEYKEAFRDKRALLVALMLALFAPIAIVLMSKITSVRQVCNSFNGSFV